MRGRVGGRTAAQDGRECVNFVSAQLGGDGRATAGLPGPVDTPSRPNQPTNQPTNQPKTNQPTKQRFDLQSSLEKGRALRRRLGRAQPALQPRWSGSTPTPPKNPKKAERLVEIMTPRARLLTNDNVLGLEIRMVHSAWAMVIG